MAIAIVGSAGILWLAGPKGFLLHALRFFPPLLLACRLMSAVLLLGTLGLALALLASLRIVARPARGFFTVRGSRFLLTIARAAFFLLFLLLFVKAVNSILIEQVAKGGGIFLTVLLGFEALGLDTILVQRNDLKSLCGSQNNCVDRRIALSGVSDFALESIGLEEVIGGVLGLEVDILSWELTDGLDVGVDLKVDATLELSALACQVLRVQGDILETGSTGSHRYKTRHPCCTAQGPATGSDAADATGFLTGSDLLHLDAYLEDVGKHLDELAEIHTFVGDIVENRLIAIALLLNVSNLHLKSQIDSDFARANHRVLFACLGLLIALHVSRLGLAEDAQYLGILAQVHTLHLVLDQTPGKTHATDIVTWIGLDSDPVTALERDVGAVAVEASTCVLEEHLDNFKVIVGYIFKPVGAGEVTASDVIGTLALTSAALGTGVSALGQGHLIVVLILVHFDARRLYLA